MAGLFESKRQATVDFTEKSLEESARIISDELRNFGETLSKFPGLSSAAQLLFSKKEEIDACIGVKAETATATSFRLFKSEVRLGSESQEQTVAKGASTLHKN